jgi:aminoglycoside phosphotransferase (APT) family kinase protein
VALGLGEFIATGTRSRVYAWGRGAVAKVPVASTPDEWIHAEASYTAAVVSVGAPAPRFLGIEQVHGRAAAIYERVVGPSMWEYVLQEPDRAAQCGAVLAQVQLDLAALVPPVALPRQADRLSAKIRRACDAAGTSGVSVDASPSLVPHRNGAPTLCHGDLHPGNVILAASGPVLVDWFDASCGDVLADMARTLRLLALDHGHCPPHLAGAEISVLTALADAYATRFTELLAVDSLQLRKWQGAEAVACLSEALSPSERAAQVWGRAARLEASAI